MPEGPAQPLYSYRLDPAVPAFPDDAPLFLFDGVCVLCSTGVAWLMRHDHHIRFRFAAAQSDLGRALYRHYGFTLDETYLLLDQGRLYSKSTGYLRVFRILGGPWRVLCVLRFVPRFLRDAIYDVIARHRYRWFGKTEYCGLIPLAFRDRLLPSNPP